jgi:ribulose-phosphate 3-epimerase
MIIAPSVLSANFLHLETDIDLINKSDADWFHIDIMDGVFVPNISFGTPVMEVLNKTAQKPMDVHLMIVDPDRFVPLFAGLGASIISVHYEACTHLHRSLQNIKSNGARAGVAINPHTSVKLLADTIHDIDLVCMMSVNPGFGGQKFIENTYRKCAELKELILQRNAGTLIEIDGGVTLENAPLLKKHGADVLVAGNTVFRSSNPAETIRKLKQTQDSALV